MDQYKIAITISLIVFAFLMLSVSEDTSKNKNEPQAVNYANLENYTLKDSSKERIAGINLVKKSWEKDEQIFESNVYKDIDQNFAENYIETKSKEIESLYVNKPAPYEGIPAKEVECEQKYIVETNNKSSENIKFNLYASEARTIGACGEKAYYRLKIDILYCETGDMIETKSFLPIDYNKSHPEVSCRD